MSIQKFFQPNVSRTVTFEKQKENKTKEEVRDLEEQLLKPKPLPPFVRKTNIKDTLDPLTVKIVFPNLGSVEKYRRYFKVSKHVEQSTTDITLLLLLLDELEAGRILYNAKGRRISYPE